MTTLQKIEYIIYSTNISFGLVLFTLLYFLFLWYGAWKYKPEQNYLSLKNYQQLQALETKLIRIQEITSNTHKLDKEVLKEIKQIKNLIKSSD